MVDAVTQGFERHDGHDIEQLALGESGSDEILLVRIGNPVVLDNGTRDLGQCGLPRIGQIATRPQNGNRLLRHLGHARDETVRRHAIVAAVRFADREHGNLLFPAD